MTTSTEPRLLGPQDFPRIYSQGLRLALESLYTAPYFRANAEKYAHLRFQHPEDQLAYLREHLSPEQLSAVKTSLLHSIQRYWEQARCDAEIRFIDYSAFGK